MGHEFLNADLFDTKVSGFCKISLRINLIHTQTLATLNIQTSYCVICSSSTRLLRIYHILSSANPQSLYIT